MQGVACADVHLYFKCPTTKQMRCPVNAYVEFKLRKEDKIKLKLHQSLQLQKIAFGVIFLWMISFNATACDLATTVKNTTIDGIRTFFKSQNKYVVTFVGYSGAEYEDKTAMLEKAGRVLDEFDASKTIVNIGATPSYLSLSETLFFQILWLRTIKFRECLLTIF